MKTERFLSELKTATAVRELAKKDGVCLYIDEAHRAWYEHSQDYCAEWLSPDSEIPESEMRIAYKKYIARRQ